MCPRICSEWLWQNGIFTPGSSFETHPEALSPIGSHKDLSFSWKCRVSLATCSGPFTLTPNSLMTDV